MCILVLTLLPIWCVMVTFADLYWCDMGCGGGGSAYTRLCYLPLSPVRHLKPSLHWLPTTYKECNPIWAFNPPEQCDDCDNWRGSWSASWFYISSRRGCLCVAVGRLGQGIRIDGHAVDTSNPSTCNSPARRMLVAFIDHILCVFRGFATPVNILECLTGLCQNE